MGVCTHAYLILDCIFSLCLNLLVHFGKACVCVCDLVPKGEHHGGLGF